MPQPSRVDRFQGFRRRRRDVEHGVNTFRGAGAIPPQAQWRWRRPNGSLAGNAHGVVAQQLFSWLARWISRPSKCTPEGPH